MERGTFGMVTNSCNFSILSTYNGREEPNYRELKSNYRELKSNYRELKSNYRELKSNYRELKSNYREPVLSVPAEEIHRHRDTK